jgi:hypothetical protein
LVFNFDERKEIGMYQDIKVHGGTIRRSYDRPDVYIPDPPVHEFRPVTDGELEAIFKVALFIIVLTFLAEPVFLVYKLCVLGVASVVSVWGVCMAFSPLLTYSGIGVVAAGLVGLLVWMRFM